MNRVIEFNNYAQGNEALSAELAGIAGMADYAAIAKREGFDISAEELEAFVASQADGQGAELSDSELEQVSGGTVTIGGTFVWSRCIRRC